MGLNGYTVEDIKGALLRINASEPTPRSAWKAYKQALIDARSAGDHLASRENLDLWQYADYRYRVWLAALRVAYPRRLVP